ncbi:MAG: chromosome segregation protein SMC [archaeon]
MTYIKRLTAKGFKSFAKKVDIPFGTDFNVVIGVNGSGKSNICDAICFVLGELSSKGLRAAKSANLIYNGGKKGSPAKEAEVSLVLCNEKNRFPINGKEVKITRILNKKGQSKYLINDQVRTRTQILDLMAAAKIDPDGHNIVLQGDIVRFMDMKPDERREIIEDVAGISIFEEKKEKAMGDLNKVQEKLNEADIILTERDKTLSDLKTDRDQALKYKDVESDLERSKATRVHLQIKDKQDKKTELETAIKTHDNNIQKTQEEIDGLKKDIEGKQQTITSIETDLDEKGDKKQRAISKEIDELKTELIKMQTRKDVCTNEITKLSNRTKELNQNLSDLSKTLSQLTKRKEQIEKENTQLTEKEEKSKSQIEEYKKKHGIKDVSDINSKIEELDQIIENKQKQTLDLQESNQAKLREKDRLEFEIKQIEEKLTEIEDLKEEDKARAKTLKEKKEEFKKLEKELSGCLNESSIFSSQLGNARSKLLGLGDELAKLRAKSIGINELSAGDAALKKIQSAKIPGVYGTVSELGKVSSKHSMALEVAAGARLRSVVVSTDAVAAKCITLLKESKSGVVTFLPLNKLREKIITEEAKKLARSQGAHGLALDLVTYDKKFDAVFKYLFGSTIVVDDISTARRIGIGRERMVTIDGDLLEQSGAMVGGYRKRTGMAFQEKEVTLGLERLEKEEERLQETVNLLDRRKTENDESVFSLRERKAILEAGIRTMENAGVTDLSLEDLKQKKKSMASEISEIQKQMQIYSKDISDIGKEILQTKQERTGLMTSMSKASGSTAQGTLNKFEEEKREIREQAIKNASELKNITSQLSFYQAEQSKVASIISTSAKEKEQFTTEFNTLKQAATERYENLKQKEKTQRQFYADYNHLFTKKNKLQQQIQQREVQIIRQEERARGIEARRNDVSVKIALINGELEGLNKEFEPYKEVSLRRGLKVEELHSEIRNLEQQMKAMGNINLRALEIYEKVRVEYDALVEKYETLRFEKEDVLKLIYEVETKKKAIFMKTFNAVQKTFKNIFATLSTKGEAILELENQEDPFEGGADIRVRMASNKFLDIKGLSGGEKTLAALSLIFALQEFQPAAFYLMDEVDAALDKHNSELLSQLIAKYSQGAQYLLISHNDSVITEANTVYGISMQDGISKVTCLKI